MAWLAVAAACGGDEGQIPNGGANGADMGGGGVGQIGACGLSCADCEGNRAEQCTQIQEACDAFTDPQQQQTCCTTASIQIAICDPRIAKDVCGFDCSMCPDPPQIAESCRVAQAACGASRALPRCCETLQASLRANMCL